MPHTHKRPIVDIGIVCSNVDEFLHFYRDLLGFHVVLDFEIPEDTAVSAGLAPRGFRQVRLKAGETLIKLMEIKNPPARKKPEFSSGVRWLTFFVDDAHRTYRELSAKSVRFLSEPVAVPDAPAVVCAVDPDGVLAEFVQLPPSAR